MLKRNFLSEDIATLASGFHLMPVCHSSDVVAATYEWALSNKKIQVELIERYFNYIREKNATT